MIAISALSPKWKEKGLIVMLKSIPFSVCFQLFVGEQGAPEEGFSNKW
jgi:hypothetical protein